MRVVLVLWNGAMGGAETVVFNLARAFRNLCVDASVLFVESPLQLEARLRLAGVPYSSLGLQRGRHLLAHPRAAARAVSRLGDAAILPECGFVGGVLRAGGFRGRIVAVEHGALLSTRRRGARRTSPLDATARVIGGWADDVEVAVSHFMLSELRRVPHAAVTVRIPNGVSLQRNTPPPNSGAADSVVVGAAGRFAVGKGFDVLMRAMASVISEHPNVVLRLAGDGPLREDLESLANDLGLGASVTLLGRIDDVMNFWRNCDLAVVPSNSVTESFSMTTLEAMACGRPVVATQNGGIPELVANEQSGILVPRGSVDEMAIAISRYVVNPSLRASHGAAARERCAKYFDISDSARAYLAQLEGPRLRGLRFR